MTTILKKTMAFFCIIGLIGVVSIAIFHDNNITFISQHHLANGMVWYKIDTYRYLQNLKGTATLNFWTMITNAPTIPNFNINDVLSVGITALLKCLFLIINWAIYILGILALLPLKLIMQVVLVIISILGIDLTEIRETCVAIYQFNIPYLDYALIGG